jgi:ABC-type glutathione transport system ATPase component
MLSLLAPTTIMQYTQIHTKSAKTSEEYAMESKDTLIHEEQFPTQIVCIYAMREEPFYHELQTHLSLWQREGYIQWLETQAGSDVEETMHAHLRQADLILLLISPSFFAHDLCYTAMKAALQEYTRRKAPVVPVLARAFDWKESVCGGLYALPDNEQPLAEWSHPGQAYENVRAGLARFIPGLSVQVGRASTEAIYRKLVVKAYQWLNFSGFDRSDGLLSLGDVPLEKVFVRLSLTVEKVVKSGESQQRERVTTVQEPIELGEALGNHLLIVGEPGAGKSTLLRWLAVTFALERQRETDRVIVSRQ